MRYCFSIGLTEFEAFIGIRNDEALRAIQIQASCENFLHPKFPLIEENIVKKDVMDFWASQPFDLQLKDYEGNCDLCFLKSDWKRRRIMRDNPARADWWINHENEFTAKARKGTIITFRADETYAGVLADVLHPEFNFEQVNDADISCSCAEKGFEKEKFETA